jgi:hypothetical protein
VLLKTSEALFNDESGSESEYMHGNCQLLADFFDVFDISLIWLCICEICEFVVCVIYDSCDSVRSLKDRRNRAAYRPGALC